MFLPRYAMVRNGEEDKLITPLDKNIAKGILVVVPVVVFYGFFSANSQYPETIPLQASLDMIPPLPEKPVTVKAKVKRAVYNIPQRAMTMVVEVKNEGTKPLEIVEFTTSSVRFINPTIAIDTSNTPSEYVVKSGLVVEPNATIQPGETVSVKLTATDAAWETEHLSSVIQDADSRFGGLLFFFDD